MARAGERQEQSVRTLTMHSSVSSRSCVGCAFARQAPLTARQLTGCILYATRPLHVARRVSGCPLRASATPDPTDLHSSVHASVKLSQHIEHSSSSMIDFADACACVCKCARARLRLRLRVHVRTAPADICCSLSSSPDCVACIFCAIACRAQ